MAQLDSLRSHWRSALLSADVGLRAGERFLPPAARYDLRKHLSDEYAPTATLLRSYAHDEGFAPELAEPFLPRALARRLLRLPEDVTACVFELDGVLVAGDALHMAAWQRTFGEFLNGRVESTYRRVAPPFDAARDYPQLIRGRPRLEGVREFLASRGIRIGEDEVQALADRKRELFRRQLADHGVGVYDGVRHYLELAHDAGVACAVSSASEHAQAVVAAAGLDDLVDNVPVDPTRTALFVATERGIVPSYRFVVLVNADARRTPPGADLVVPSLAALLLR